MWRYKICNTANNFSFLAFLPTPNRWINFVCHKNALRHEGSAGNGGSFCLIGFSLYVPSTVSKEVLAMTVFAGQKLIEEILMGSGISSMSGSFMIKRLLDMAQRNEVTWIALKEEEQTLRNVLTRLGLSDASVKIVAVADLKSLGLAVGDRLLCLPNGPDGTCSRWKVSGEFSPCYE